ncbi:MAG: D-alanyl-D-alanine carboxypeptidase family protein [Gaiellaceae bacterium]
MRSLARYLGRQRRLSIALVGLVTAVLVVSGVEASTRAVRLSPPTLKARAAVVIDQDTGAVLYTLRGATRQPPASLTKVMTALLVLERVRNLGSYVRVPYEAVGARGTNIGLEENDRITVRNLLRCALIRGAGDCAVVLAYYVGGSEKAFAAMMNARARQLGLKKTHFVNPSGVTDPGHYSSALDLARLARVAMANARFRALVADWKVHVRWRPNHDVVVESRNWLVREFGWGTGVKTGSSAAAGICMIASGDYGWRSLIVVTLHEHSLERERSDVLRLFEYGSLQ